MKKIPMVFMAYFNRQIVSSAFYRCYDERLDIYVVENTSAQTPIIKQDMEFWVDEEMAKKYFLFEENIAGNAIRKVLEDGQIPFDDSDYIIITDGDLFPDAGWLDEHLAILDNNPEVFCVATALKMDNLPVKSMPDSANWIPPNGADHGDYIEAQTGGHLLTFRMVDFLKWEEYRKRTGARFIDTAIHYFATSVLGMKTAKTKQTSSIHMTWSLYQDLEHPYTKERLALTDAFGHDKLCAYTVYPKPED